KSAFQGHRLGERLDHRLGRSRRSGFLAGTGTNGRGVPDKLILQFHSRKWKADLQVKTGRPIANRATPGGLCRRSGTQSRQGGKGRGIREDLGEMGLSYYEPAGWKDGSGSGTGRYGPWNRI